MFQSVIRYCLVHISLQVVCHEKGLRRLVMVEYKCDLVCCIWSSYEPIEGRYKDRGLLYSLKPDGCMEVSNNLKGGKSESCME